MNATTRLANWGNFPRVHGRLLHARDAAETQAAIAAEPSLIAHGNGRAYGDAALNLRATLSMRRCDRLLAFDPASGHLTCEAGLLLSDLIEIFLPRGWFVPVTPGTRFVTIGGMIAADVHGKNHHGAGSFGDHVESLTLALADGRTVTCSPTEDPDLFEATRGGMGLTGVILDATFRLLPVETAYVRQETLRAANLAEVMALFDESHAATYTVAWIDCLARGAALGRSLLYRADPLRRQDLPAGLAARPLAVPPKRPWRVPFDFPGFALNRWSVQAFNARYYRKGVPGSEVVDFASFFYPLDAIDEWNRIYGRRGLVQYQCVLPKAASLAGTTALLERIARSGRASFLAVLKLLGRQERGWLSFPMEGYTLALDFAADPATFALLLELDAIVADHGGRLYLAKDARSGVQMMRDGYPKLEAFLDLRRRIDPAGKFSSLQSQRLGL